VHTKSGLTALENSAVRSLARASKLTEVQIVRVGLHLLFGYHFQSGRPNPDTLAILKSAAVRVDRSDGELREFQLACVVDAAVAKRAPLNRRELARVLKGGAL